MREIPQPITPMGKPEVVDSRSRDRWMPRYKKPNLPEYDNSFIQRWKESISEHTRQKQLIKLLAKVPIFADTTEVFRSAMIQVLVPVEYHSGQTVFQQGEAGDWMGIVLRGRLERQVVRDADSGVVKIGELAPGEVAGDLGLLGISKTRTVTVVATEQTVLLTLEKRRFHEVLEELDGAHHCRIMEDAEHMQDIMADFESICSMECFRRLEKKFVLALCKHLEPRLVYPKTVLMRESNYGNEMYILHMGQVKVEKGGQFIVKLTGGVVIGELAVLGSDKRRTATVTCVKLALVYVLHGDLFREIIESFPRSKAIFDHSYISRLVSVEMSKVREEMHNLNQFYGNAHPMTTEQVIQKLDGAQCGGELTKLVTIMGILASPKKKDSSLPMIAGKYTPRTAKVRIGE